MWRDCRFAEELIVFLNMFHGYFICSVNRDGVPIPGAGHPLELRSDGFDQNIYVENRGILSEF